MLYTWLTSKKILREQNQVFQRWQLYYNSRLKVLKSRKEFFIRIDIRELIQSIYLIYTKLVICVILYLTYPKDYVVNILYNMWHHAIPPNLKNKINEK